jgi:hypothetical protein
MMIVKDFELAFAMVIVGCTYFCGLMLVGQLL